MEGLSDVRSVRVETPFGDPSDEVILGELGGRRLAFLPRHGKGHRLLPSEINFRANIFALKKLGVERILSVSAVGSMKEEIAPGHIVIPDQFVDLTKRRVSTFFGSGVVGHAAMGDPVCAETAGILSESGRAVGATVHPKGTYVCIEGPQFSTRAESNIYRGWGVDVIGMTNVTEAKLAREAEICYATIALATDYDCWHEEHDDVTVEAVLKIMKQNVETARRILAKAVSSLPSARGCSCGAALQNAVMTAPDLIPAQTRRDLDPLIGKYLSAPSRA
ncbi:MAG: methylthioadenosine phosphorylase [Nitrospirae bacterium RBG_16_64_22]|nr:MAG: methylthioadenosine phosphorylase [Nitrospirae bacterium RBG_16_64_22]